MTRLAGNQPFFELSDLPGRLREWRESNGIKVSTAAAELGVAPSTWSHWEAGRRFPSGTLLIALVNYTGVSLVDFICENSADCPFRKRR